METVTIILLAVLAVFGVVFAVAARRERVYEQARRLRARAPQADPGSPAAD